MGDARPRPRFRMLAVVREYALECLAAAGEAEVVRLRHLRWCIALAARAQDAAFGPYDGVWLDRLEAEHPNLRVALSWALGTRPTGGDTGNGAGGGPGLETLRRWPAPGAPAGGDTALWEGVPDHDSSVREAAHAPALGLELASGLHRFWFLRGHRHSGAAWLEAALEQTAHLPPAGGGARPLAQSLTLARARALFGLGMLASQDDNARARDFLDAALSVFQECGDARGTAESLIQLAGQLRHTGDIERARRVLQEGLAAARALDDHRLVVSALVAMSYTAGFYPDAEREAAASEALVLSRRHDFSLGVAMASRVLGDIALRRRAYESARTYFAEDLARTLALGDRGGAAFAHNKLGDVAMLQGDLRGADEHFGAALALYQVLRLPRRVALVLYKAGQLALATGDAPAARQHWAQSLALWQEAADGPWVSVVSQALAELDHAPSDAGSDIRAGMGAAVTATPGASQAARVPPVTDALDGPGTVGAETPAAAGGRTRRGSTAVYEPLSAREMEVALLVARGYSNKQIARELGLRLRTVTTHLEHIRNKLAASSRTQIAVWALGRQHALSL